MIFTFFYTNLIIFTETYAEAMRKLKKLETEDHVLTMESDDNVSAITDRMTQEIIRRKLQVQAEKLKLQILSDKAETPKCRNDPSISQDTNTDKVEASRPSDFNEEMYFQGNSLIFNLYK